MKHYVFSCFWKSETDAARRADAGSRGEIGYGLIYEHSLAVQVQEGKGTGFGLTQPNVNPYG